MNAIMRVFGIDCNFFIVLPIRLKTYRFNVFPLFTRRNLCVLKIGCVLEVHQHRARNFFRPDTPAIWIDTFAPSSYKYRFAWSSFEFQHKDTVWNYQVKNKNLKTWYRLFQLVHSNKREALCTETTFTGKSSNTT